MSHQSIYEVTERMSLQGITDAVNFAATANAVEMLPPELLRKGRFDELFFVDLPTREERKEIFTIKQRQRNVTFDVSQRILDASEHYTGAEIEAAIDDAMFTAFDDSCRSVTADDVILSLMASVPVSKTMEDKISSLRNWAADRCRPAGIAQSVRVKHATKKSRAMLS